MELSENGLYSPKIDQHGRWMVTSIKSTIHQPVNLSTSNSHSCFIIYVYNYIYISSASSATILEYGSSHWVPWLPWVPWVRLGPGPGHAPFESKTGNAQETYGLVKRGIETVHFPSSVKLQVRHMGTGDKQYQGRKMLEIGGIRSIYLIYFETRGSKEGWPWFWTHCAAEATKFSMCFICVSCFSLFLCLDYHSKYQGIRRHPI
jgi:hypothetical protein